MIDQAKSDMREIRPLIGKVCWFCLKAFLKGQRVEEHHLVPQRLVPNLRISKVRVHAFCHELWNQQHGTAHIGWEKYRAKMKPIAYGYGIFKDAPWLLQGFMPRHMEARRWVHQHPTMA